MFTRYSIAFPTCHWTLRKVDGTSMVFHLHFCEPGYWVWKYMCCTSYFLFPYSTWISRMHIRSVNTVFFLQYTDQRVLKTSWKLSYIWYNIPFTQGCWSQGLRFILQDGLPTFVTSWYLGRQCTKFLQLFGDVVFYVWRYVPALQKNQPDTV